MRAHWVEWAYTAAWRDAPPRDTPGVPRPRAPPAHGRRLLGVGPGLEVSRRHLFQDAIVEGEIRHQAFQPGILLFQTLEPFRLIDAQAAVFFLPPILRLLGDTELATRVRDSQPFARLDFDRPEMPNDVFRRISFACHVSPES